MTQMITTAQPIINVHSKTSWNCIINCIRSWFSVLGITKRKEQISDSRTVMRKNEDRSVSKVKCDSCICKAKLFNHIVESFEDLLIYDKPQGSIAAQ